MRTENSQPLVRAIDVRKRFGDTEVLSGVNLDVHRGEVLCIIGPSGSGKSTFLRCINQLEIYQEGKIFVNDELIAGCSQLVTDRSYCNAAESVWCSSSSTFFGT